MLNVFLLYGLYVLSSAPDTPTKDIFVSGPAVMYFEVYIAINLLCRGVSGIVADCPCGV